MRVEAPKAARLQPARCDVERVIPEGQHKPGRLLVRHWVCAIPFQALSYLGVAERLWGWINIQKVDALKVSDH